VFLGFLMLLNSCLYLIHRWNFYPLHHLLHHHLLLQLLIRLRTVSWHRLLRHLILNMVVVRHYRLHHLKNLSFLYRWFRPVLRHLTHLLDRRRLLPLLVHGQHLMIMNNLFLQHNVLPHPNLPVLLHQIHHLHLLHPIGTCLQTLHLLVTLPG
jgi:hypothetical protein